MRRTPLTTTPRRQLRKPPRDQRPKERPRTIARYGHYHNVTYDTIRDAILTCARKPTRVSLINRTETTTKKCKTEKLKTKNGYAQK